MPPDPGGGPGTSPTSHRPDLRTGTPAWAGDSVSGGQTRSFEQIIQEEKRNRNIIEIQLTKIQRSDENGKILRPKSLTFEELGELIFDVFEIKPEDCIAINLNTGRYNQREVKL